jgi:hypothetical protein
MRLHKVTVSSVIYVACNGRLSCIINLVGCEGKRSWPELRYNSSISPEAFRIVFVGAEIRIWTFRKTNQKGYSFSQITRFTILRTDKLSIDLFSVNDSSNNKIKYRTLNKYSPQNC